MFEINQRVNAGDGDLGNHKIKMAIKVKRLNKIT